MKNLFAILFLLAFASKSQAQFLQVFNMRPCYIDVSLKGQCPGGACNGVSVLLHIPPFGSATIPTFAAAILDPSYISGGSCATPAGFTWHAAQIQSVSCFPCSGYGVSVGDGTCPDPITGVLCTPGPNCFSGGPDCEGLIYCAKWETFDGGIKITAY